MIEVRCENCQHFKKSIDKQDKRGECICVLSKYYKDIIKMSESCNYFHEKLKEE